MIAPVGTNFHSHTMKETIEKKAADLLLGRNKTIKIGNKYIKQPQITGSTLIAVSEAMAGIPIFRKKQDSGPIQELNFALFKSKEYKGVFDAMAILALGCPLSGSDTWLKRRKRRRLARYIADNVPAAELTGILSQLLEGQDTRLFFELTTSLSELNILAGKSETTSGVQ